MRIAALIALLIAVLTACAIPVRPIAKIVPGKDGTAHFIADPAQEPQLGDAVGILGGLTGLLGGPWGKIIEIGAGLLIGAAGGHHVGHKRGKKSASKPEQSKTKPE